MCRQLSVPSLVPTGSVGSKNAALSFLLDYRGMPIWPTRAEESLPLPVTLINERREKRREGGACGSSLPALRCPCSEAHLDISSEAHSGPEQQLPILVTNLFASRYWLLSFTILLSHHEYTIPLPHCHRFITYPIEVQEYLLETMA